MVALCVGKENACLTRRQLNGTAVMRYGAIVTICLASLAFSGMARAGAVLNGTVAAVHPARDRFDVHLPAMRKTVHVLMVPNRLPSAVGTGTRITVFGRFLPGRADVFRAERIVPVPPPLPVPGPGRDPTGVRSRIFRGLRRPMPPF